MSRRAYVSSCGWAVVPWLGLTREADLEVVDLDRVS